MPLYLVVDSIFTLIYVIDIVISFRTTFVNKHGEEIFNARFIARQYVLGGRFFIDVLATFPFEHLQSSECMLMPT